MRIAFLALLIQAGPALCILPPPDPERPEAWVAETEPTQTGERSYIVQGTSLKARFEVAVEHAGLRSRESGISLGWSFEVRPGFDAGLPEGYSASCRTGLAAVAGREADVRRGSISIRLRPGQRVPETVQICSASEAAPLYWLGRVKPAESVAFLEGVARSRVAAMKAPFAAATAAEAARAIGLHDEPSVAPLLRDLARRSPHAAVRGVAAGALARRPEQLGFVVGIVLDQREVLAVRAQAVSALAASPDAGAAATLRGIAERVKPAELARTVLETAARLDGGSQAPSRQVGGVTRSSSGALLPARRLESGRGPAVVETARFTNRARRRE